MTLPKEIIIKELMNEFQYEEDKATFLFNAYLREGKVEELSECIQAKKVNKCL